MPGILSNPLTKIAIYLVAVVVVATALAPPVFWGIQTLGSHDLAFGLQSHPFHRVFSRIAQISAMVFLWPLIRSLRIRSLTDFGIHPNPRRWKDVGVGIVIAVIPVLALAIGYLMGEVYKFRSDFAWTSLIRVFFTAAFVSVFEEFLFRGVFLGLALRSMRVVPALALSSAVFSVIHFIKPKGIIAPDAVTWDSGIWLLSTSFEGGPTGLVLSGGLISLFVIGWITGAATVGTRSLWLAIGLHAGWIFVQQTFSLIARYRIKPADALMPWIGPNVVSGMVPTGLVPIVVILVSGVCVWWYLKRVCDPYPPRGN